MRIEENQSDQTLLREIGERVTMLRLNQNLTQATLAEQAGISKRTVERLEMGESVQVKSLVRLLRSLGLLQRLDLLFPEPVPSPIAQLKLQGKRRRRASSKESQDSKGSKGSKGSGWQWGDES